MDGFVVVVFIFLVFILIMVLYRNYSIRSDKRDMETKLINESNFTATQKIIGEDGKTGLAIDERRKKIGLITLNHIDVIPYNDILSSEIFEDGNTITRSSRTSQLGGALLGGLVLGGGG